MLARALLLLAVGATLAAPAHRTLSGQAAPLLALRDVHDRMVFLRDLVGPSARPPMRKKALVLDFFATFCKPCQRELPHVVELNERWKSKDVEVILIGFGETPETLAEFALQKNIPLRVLSDRYNVASKQYGVDQLPRVVVVGADGKVKEDLVGDHENLVEELEKLLTTLTAA